jgi:hypothetical protein
MAGHTFLFYLNQQGVIITIYQYLLRYCQMLWMDKFTSFGTLTATPLYLPVLHPGIFYYLRPMESFDIPEAAANSFGPPGPV